MMGAGIGPAPREPKGDIMNIDIIHQGSVSKALRRLGLAGFLFFSIKGLLWLVIPVLIARWL